MWYPKEDTHEDVKAKAEATEAQLTYEKSITDYIGNKVAAIRDAIFYPRKSSKDQAEEQNPIRRTHSAEEERRVDPLGKPGSFVTEETANDIRELKNFVKEAQQPIRRVRTEIRPPEAHINEDYSNQTTI